MKKPALFLLCVVALCFCTRTNAQDAPLPPGAPIDMHTDLSQYDKYVIPCVNWLQQTPLDSNTKARYRIDEFLMHWLERSPDVDIPLPDYSLILHGIHREFLYLFIEGWIKYTLETGDRDHTACNMAGLKSMLDYYLSGKAAVVGRVDYLDNLAALGKEGKLKTLFDTSHNATNTYLYLKDPSAKHDFKPDENYFGFHFYSINFINPRLVTYRYMLEGYYNEWTTTTYDMATYPRLPPGSYHFRVQACMGGNFEHAAEAGYYFNIARPMWKEPWFLALIAATGAALAFVVIKQREKNLKNIALLQHERIMFEYEHLKSQVNPHFLFNSFNTLSHLIATDRDKAIDYSEKLSGLYHSIIAYHDNDLVLLSEEFAILDNYISIQKGRFGEALQLHTEITDEILNTKKIVPLALQILIENAIKHNVISQSEPLVITVSANHQEIVIRNTLHAKLSKDKGEGIGLFNIKRRYSLLTKKTVSYGAVNNEFIVTLPLL